MFEFFLSAPFVLSAIIVISVAIAVLLEFEKEGWATTLFSLGTALVLWSYKGIIWDVVSNNPIPVISFLVCYVVVGLIWSLIKWKTYISKRVQRFEEIKIKFVKEGGGDIKDNWEKWINYLNSFIPPYLRNTSFYKRDSPVEVANNMIPESGQKKSLIVSWISYWPMSLLATLLNNPFRKFFEWIYSLVSNIYDKMGSNAAALMASGLEKNEVEDLDKKNKKVLKG